MGQTNPKHQDARTGLFRVTILSPNVIGQGIVALQIFFVYDTVYMYTVGRVLIA